MPNNISLDAAALVVALISAGSCRVAAQATADSSREGSVGPTLHAPSIVGVWAAAAHHSAFQTRTGVPGHRDFYLASLRLGWTVVGNEQPRMVHVAYFVDIIPAALSTDMPDYAWNSRCRPDTLCPGATPIPHDAYAFGITPIGWSLAFGEGRTRLTMEASGGGLWFSRRIPDPVASRFNFTTSAGPTLELRVTPSQSLRVGYLWHHTSNGGTGKVNPGLNSGILAAGVLWHAPEAAR
jgi:hypothetical protein